MKKGQGAKIIGGNPKNSRIKDDFYATNPESVKSLLSMEEIIYPALEPACGQGHISKLLKENETTSCDLIYRGYGMGGIDFLKNDFLSHATVITNPPFSLFQEFVEKALLIATHKVIMFGKLQTLEGQKRATYLQSTPLKTVYVFKKRQQMLPNGKIYTGAGNTMAFAWFVWEKGFVGDPIIKWI